MLLLLLVHRIVTHDSVPKVLVGGYIRIINILLLYHRLLVLGNYQATALLHLDLQIRILVNIELFADSFGLNILLRYFLLGL